MNISTDKKPEDTEARVLGITDAGHAVPSRIDNATSAMTLFHQLETEDSTASRFRSKIQGLLDGNPPRDPAKMRRLGLAGFSNVNFREAEGVIDMNASSFWDLDMNVPAFITVKVKDDRKLAIPDELNYGNVIAEEYSALIDDWPEYYYNRMLSIGEMLKYGMGPVFWRDKYDWHFEAMKFGMVLLPSDTKALTKEPELMMVRDSMRVGELFRLIETDEDKVASNDVGWDVHEVKDAILRAQKNRVPAKDRLQIPEWEAMQQLIKNNDYAANHVTCNPVGVIHILVREVGGDKKVTHYIICEDEERVEFLFQEEGGFDSMYDVACLFVAGVGDGLIKSVKGLGHKIYPHVAQSNNFINHIVNAGYLGGSMLVTTNTPNAMSLTQFGPVTILPSHVKAIENEFSPNLDKLEGVRGILNSVLNNNTGVFKRSSEGRSGPTRTAHEVNVEEIKNAKLEKTTINIHYLQLDALHRQTMKRLLNPDYPELAVGHDEAKEFINRCVDRGVPREFLVYERLRIKAVRSVGFGSAVAQERVTGELLGVSDRFPTIGQNNALRDYVSARVGHQSVDRYVPVVTMRDIPNSETSVATLENNAIVSGMETMVGADQPHPIHVPIHLNLLAQLVEAYMKNKEGGQVDVVKTYQILARGLAHVSQHLEFWSKNPSRKAERESAEGAVKQIQQVLKQLEGKVRQVQQQQEQAAREQAAQQQQMNQVSPEMQLKLKELEEETAIKRENMLRQNEIRVEKAEHSMNLSEVKAAAEVAKKGR